MRIKLKNRINILVAIFLILIPVGIVVYFYTTRVYNRVVLPKLFPTGEFIEQSDGKGGIVYDTVYHKIPDFKLKSHTGEYISNTHFDTNGLYVAEFFFANCPNICPVMTKNLKLVQHVYANQTDQVHVLSHTIDPSRDTEETLKQYAIDNELKENFWYLLRSDSIQEIIHLANQGYKVAAQQGTGEGDIPHSNRLILVDKNRHIRGTYKGTEKEDIQQLIRDIQVLLTEYNFRLPPIKNN